MRKIILLAFIFIVINLLSSCKKDSLNLTNPNEPGIPSLQTEEGITRAGLGIYNKFGLEYWWLALGYHYAIGDEIFIAAGNFSWRWANQVASITLDNGTILTPPQGGTQIQELRARNERSFGNDNVFYNEWLAMYLVNNQCNLILSVLDKVNFTGNSETKKNTLKAWAYWWKGFIYSRIGSLYIAGIVTNTFNETNNNFVTNTQIIQEANKNFDLCVQALNNISDINAYQAIVDKVIPSFTKMSKGGVLSPEEWKRHINTYKARNLLVNKKVSDMTAVDWNTILTLTNNGIKQTDKIFTMRSADVNDLVSITAWAPYRLLATGWFYLSERLVQDFKPGDKRFTRNVTTYPSPVVNRSSRGYQYGTRWVLKDIVNGGNYASTSSGLAELTVACSYEENALMQAEALIRLGGTTNIENGLQLIDQVRQYQNAGLLSVAGTGLNQTQAIEELRKERRIGLFLKNVSFYDARRWNISTDKKTGCIILGSGGVINTNATIEYKYLDYWDIPKNEIDFNAPAIGSAPVVAPI